MAAVTLSSCVSLPAVARASSQKPRSAVAALSNFSGLKSNKTLSFGQEKTADHQFALIKSSLRTGSKGGAMTSTCSLANEIFSIIPVISGLVLLGISLGFVLLRVEAAVEESE